jgi:hypothetical protein
MRTFWDFAELIRSMNLDLDDAYVLCCIYENDIIPEGDYYKKSIDYLIKGQFITNNGTILIKGLSVLEVLYKSEEFATQLREIYPMIQLHGKSARGSLPDTIHKLTAFRKFYKIEDFTDEEILQATENYVKEQELQGRTYMKLLKYFIMKDGQSTLAEEILKLRGGFEQEQIFRGDKIM